MTAMKSRFWFLGLATAALVLTGCPEKRRPAGSTPPKTAQSSAEAEKKSGATGSLADYGKSLSNAEKTAAQTAGLVTLNQAVKQYNVIENRFPATLEELVSARYLPKLPAAPRGKRYVYDAKAGEVTVEDVAGPAPTE